jgi:carbamoyl-phosphate synthase large subunit
VLVQLQPGHDHDRPGVRGRDDVEPITPEFVEKVIEKERPDALLATASAGQTALNTAMALDEAGVLEKYGVEADRRLDRGDRPRENRQIFKKIVEELGGQVARSAICHTMDDCPGRRSPSSATRRRAPTFTMGGTGSGMAHDEAALRRSPAPASRQPDHRGAPGGVDPRLEGVRARGHARHQGQRRDRVLDREPRPDGRAHRRLDHRGAGDDADRPRVPSMRDLSIGIIRSVGVDTGGCNIQFAVNPRDGRLIVIEMNPRVSRSSALASKATGFPIAKIAAKVAIGYTLDEIPNDITRETPASFEPTLDYVVVKVPRFAFEKFPAADQQLTTHMKSVGEAMAIGRNFTEALHKALRSLESKDAPFDWHQEWVSSTGSRCSRSRSRTTAGSRTVMDAIRAGATPEEGLRGHRDRPWFGDQLMLIKEVRCRGDGRRRAAPECSGWPSGTASPTCRSARSAG